MTPKTEALECKQYLNRPRAGNSASSVPSKGVSCAVIALQVTGAGRAPRGSDDAPAEGQYLPGGQGSYAHSVIFAGF